MAIAGVFGSSFETIVKMTDTLTLTAAQANINLIYGAASMGAKTLTLPKVSQMVASQNPFIQVNCPSDGGGSITVAAATGDSILGSVTVAVATGLRYYHDGISRWFPA